MMEKVKCPICNKEMQRLTQHVIRTHDMTKEEFLDKYPGTEMISDNSRKKTSAQISARNKEMWRSDPEYRARMTEVVTNNWKDPEIRERMLSISMAERGRRSMTKNWKNPEFVEMMRGISKETMSATMTKLWSENYDEMYDMILSNIEKTGWVSGEYDGVTYRSSWEIHLAKEFSKAGVQFEYESERISYFYESRERTYIPDFYLPHNNLVIEVKPEFRLGELEEVKLQAAKDNGYKAVFVTESSLWDDDLVERLISM